MDGVFASSDTRPNFRARAESFGFRTELPAAFDIGRA